MRFMLSPDDEQATAWRIPAGLIRQERK